MIRRAALPFALAIAALSSGCGEALHRPAVPVVRVGGWAVQRATLLRWMTALAPDHEVPAPPAFQLCVSHERSLGLTLSTETLKTECEQQYRALRAKALDLLISSYWLIGAANELGVDISDRTVRSRAPAVTAATGLRGADADLRAKAELSASEVRLEIDQRVGRVTRVDAIRYYKRHIRSFERQELRHVELAENYPTAAAALKAKTEVEMGRSLAGISLHEVLERYNTTGRSQNRRAAEEAIFTADAHVLSGPVLLNAQWAIFEVTRIVEPHREAFSEAEAKIRARLLNVARRAALGAFVRSWRARWRRRTRCAPGYVIDRCARYPHATDDETEKFGLD